MARGETIGGDNLLNLHSPHPKHIKKSVIFCYSCYTVPMEDTNEAKRKLKNRIVGTAASAFTAVSLAVGALFPSPQEIMHAENDGDDVNAQAAVVSVGKRLEKSSGETSRPRGDRLRAFFLRQPAAVRGALLLPMWCVGKAMLTVLSLLWAALSPVWGILLGVLLNALLLIGLFALVYKLLFPNRSLKNLFKKRNIIVLLIGGVALSATDAILKAYWKDYAPISVWIKIGIGFAVLSLLCWRIFGKRAPKAAKAA